MMDVFVIKAPAGSTLLWTIAQRESNTKKKFLQAVNMVQDQSNPAENNKTWEYYEELGYKVCKAKLNIIIEEKK